MRKYKLNNTEKFNYIYRKYELLKKERSALSGDQLLKKYFDLKKEREHLK